ncbi:hypothetical protein BGZ74_006026 [Mortierella antarctica]|nr:hypothetical protein BGZ74_006026 [Mortierella antarctica]
MKSILNPPIPSPFHLLHLVLLLALTALPPSHAALFDQCGLSTVALFTNPVVASCIPIGPISDLITNNFTVALVNKTTFEFCSYPLCSKPAVSLIENTIIQNCATNPEDKAEFMAMFGAASLYVPFKQGLCNQVDPPRNGTYCLTLLSDSLQSYMKKHPSPDGALVFANTTVLVDYLNGLPESVLCTPCNKAMINPIDHYVAVNQLTLDPSVVSWSRAIQKQVQLKCGEDFIDGRSLAPDPTAASGGGSVWRMDTLLLLFGLCVYTAVVQ